MFDIVGILLSVVIVCLSYTWLYMDLPIGQQALIGVLFYNE